MGRRGHNTHNILGNYKRIKQKNRFLFLIKKYSVNRLVEKILFKALTKFEKFLFIFFFKNFDFKKVNLSENKIILI